MARYRVGSKLEYKPERSVGKLKSSATSKPRSSWRTWSPFGRPKATRLALNIVEKDVFNETELKEFEKEALNVELINLSFS